MKQTQAWKRLGCRRYRGKWLYPEQIAAAKAEDDAQRRADKHWAVRLFRWKHFLTLKAKKAGGEAHLAEIDDPRAVAMVWRLFGMGGPKDQEIAARVLARIDGPAASQRLALLAGMADSEEARDTAAESLLKRDPRDVVDFLIELLRPTLRIDVRPVRGPGSPGELVIEGEREIVRRAYAVPTPPNVQLLPGETLRLDALGLPVIVLKPVENPANRAQPPTELVPVRGVAPGANINEAQKATLAAQAQMATDVAGLNATNAAIRRHNLRIEQLLRSLTGRDEAGDREAWRAWWTDQKGYAYEPLKPSEKAVVDQVAQLNYVPLYARPASHSCFAAGTAVRTRDGDRAIESIRAGDQVLSQDVTTGSLSFQPVVAVFHNKPATTVRVRMEGDEVTATGIHRFWRVGKGWTMARDLKPGDSVRVVGGSARVLSAEPEKVQPVFNLEVARGHSFFVGRRGALVHDNTTVEATPSPFDARPSAYDAAAVGR